MEKFHKVSVSRYKSSVCMFLFKELCLFCYLRYRKKRIIIYLKYNDWKICVKGETYGNPALGVVYKKAVGKV